jgi:porphobilinogen synthase
MQYPFTRLRRLRTTPGMRRLVRETSLSAANLVEPLFVCPGTGKREEIESLEGCCHLSVDMLEGPVEEISKAGIPAVLLFGLPRKKDEKGSDAWAADGAVQEAVRRIKEINAELIIITDVCLCAYTSHGHCGVLDGRRVDNDATLPILAKVALSHAEAGADIVAPSDMMDGRVRAIREALDANGHIDTAILSYTAKFASAFYGPFRDAADSAPAFGDRKTYQADWANPRQAMREIEEDIAEGADMVMVKPALAYLDIICRARQRFDVPVAAYNVSGEYAMLKAAAKAGAMDYEAVLLETLYAIRRAGADIIITYAASEAAKLLGKK